MLGAGVFVVFGPATSYAGSLLPIAVLIAAAIAYLNAMSISQLARTVTRSGGAYAYARHYISNPVGFIAGAAFLVGKLGSTAAIALTFATFLTPGSEIITAIAALVTMTTLNIFGITRTALGSKILALITIGFLAVVILAASLTPAAAVDPLTPEPLGLLSAAALIFFAFAGYARVATLGSEVANSAVAIPKAIRISLGIVVLIYLALAIVLPIQLGRGLSGDLTAIAELTTLVLPGIDGNVVWIFAASASLGSLLALLAGLGRTASTMAEDGELPKSLVRRNSYGVPWLAESIIALIGMLLVLTNSVEFVVSLSSFCVLIYYAIANWAAYRQPRTDANRPKWLNVLGLIACLALALSVPVSSILVGSSGMAALFVLRLALAKLGTSR
jgi:APA family basic amino acid/polyamine antiporter